MQKFSETFTLLDGVTSATAGKTIIDTSDKPVKDATVQVDGIGTATVTFKGSLDNSNWYGLGVGIIDGSGTYPLIAGGQTVTADGIRRLIDIPKFIRADTTAYTSGTVTVLAYLRY